MLNLATPPTAATEVVPPITAPAAAGDAQGDGGGVGVGEVAIGALNGDGNRRGYLGACGDSGGLLGEGDFAGVTVVRSKTVPSPPLGPPPVEVVP